MVPQATATRAIAASLRMASILRRGSRAAAGLGGGFGGALGRLAGGFRGGRLHPRYGHDLTETAERRLPIREERGRPIAARSPKMLLDEGSELGLVFGGDLACDHAIGGELPPFGHVGDAAGHPRACVPAHRSEGDRDPACHVLTEMIARTLDDGHGA